MNPKHYLLSQQGGLTEELKKTLLAEIPIVFIITDQLGLEKRLAFTDIFCSGISFIHL